MDPVPDLAPALDYKKIRTWLTTKSQKLCCQQFIISIKHNSRKKTVKVSVFILNPKEKLGDETKKTDLDFLCSF